MLRITKNLSMYIQATKDDYKLTTLYGNISVKVVVFNFVEAQPHLDEMMKVFFQKILTKCLQ